MALDAVLVPETGFILRNARAWSQKDGLPWDPALVVDQECERQDRHAARRIVQRKPVRLLMVRTGCHHDRADAVDDAFGVTIWHRHLNLGKKLVLIVCEMERCLSERQCDVVEIANH